MKIYFGDMLIEVDPNYEPVVIVFDTDEERMHVGNDIVNMPARAGVRAYAQFPSILEEQARQEAILAAVKKHEYYE